MLSLQSSLRRSLHQAAFMEPKVGFIGAVGMTPLIRLDLLSKQTGCTIYGKAEFMNPGGSVKDRAARFIVEDAEQKGLIGPGGTIVEGTAGNTGIGLAHVCRARGYKCVIYMPNTQSQEKIDLLRMLGADVRPVPAVAFTDPNNYNHQAARYAESIQNAVWTNQFDNTANRLAHYKTTGPEIWSQLNGKLHGFTCSTGTGGTLYGTGLFLKEKDPNIKVFIADPPGSVLYKYFKSNFKELARTGESSITEGIGQGRVTENMKGSEQFVDDALHIPDEETIKMVYELLHYDGIFIGASSALNVVAAVKMAKVLGPGHTVVTIICDGAYRYQSRLFSRKWLESKKLIDAIPKELHSYIILP